MLSVFIDKTVKKKTLFVFCPCCTVYIYSVDHDILKIIAAGKYTIQTKYLYTDKKEKKIFLKYKAIQMGSVANKYMKKGFLIYEEMRKYLVIIEKANILK